MTRHARTIIRSEVFHNSAPVKSSEAEVFLKGTSLRDKRQIEPSHEYKMYEQKDHSLLETSGTDLSLAESPQAEGALEINRTTLRNTLAELYRSRDLKIQELNAEQTEVFRSVVETLRLLYNSPALYELILRDVKEVFQEVTQVRPGTVASFFRGCFTDDTFSGPLGCSPKCADSLPPADGTPGYSKCDDLVLIYLNGDFNSLNNKISPHAYIYIENENFTAFTRENVHKLRDAGIEKVSLVFGSTTGDYQNMQGPVAVEALPVSESEDENANAGAVIALVTLIVIILILFLLILYRNSY